MSLLFITRQHSQSPVKKAVDTGTPYITELSSVYPEETSPPLLHRVFQKLSISHSFIGEERDDGCSVGRQGSWATRLVR
jgi:hypothetical protein